MLARLRHALRPWRLRWAVTAEREVNDLWTVIQQNASTHRAQLEVEHKRIDDMMVRLRKLHSFRELDGCYRLTITLDPRVVHLHHGQVDRRDLEVLADYCGRQAARQMRLEVLASRFLTTDRRRPRPVAP